MVVTVLDWNPSSANNNDTLITDEINISQITQKFTIKVSSGLVISQKAYYKSGCQGQFVHG